MYKFNSRFLGLLRKYSSGANKQGYYLAGLETLVTRDTAWLEVLPKVSRLLNLWCGVYTITIVCNYRFCTSCMTKMCWKML